MRDIGFFWFRASNIKHFLRGLFMKKSDNFRNSFQNKRISIILIYLFAALMFFQISAVYAASGGEGGGSSITVIPDWSVLIQIVNFLVLIWALNIVLYKPIRNIISKRKEKISGLESDIDTAETKAVEQDQAFADGIKDARANGLKQKEALLQAAADEEKNLISQINEKAQAELTKIREQIAGEASEAKQALMKDVDGFASAISEKILGRGV